MLSVRRLSEAPEINAPQQVVAPSSANRSPSRWRPATSDQDPLTWNVDGLPIGAELEIASQYGQGTLTWTPTADDIGNHEIELIVSDSGLPPRDAGYIEPADPVPNVSRHRLRIIVRAENAAARTFGLQVDGETIADSGDVLRFDARERTPLAIQLLRRGCRRRGYHRTAGARPAARHAGDCGGQPPVAVLDARPFCGTGQQHRDHAPGLWRFSVGGSDGMAKLQPYGPGHGGQCQPGAASCRCRSKLVNEGETLHFTVRASDADHDAVQFALLHDEKHAIGVEFNAASGSFEWTPDQDTVDNGNADSRPYTFTFSASDGLAVATQQVQVRVFDLNRRPQISVGNHAVAVGDTLSLPVVFDGSVSNGIAVFDPDGPIQSQALALSFANLPTGATYDSHTQRLTWTPGPGQIGDTLVTAQVYDGRPGANASSTHSFVLRAVVDLAAQPPQILISTTPSLPVNPGQLLMVSVRAEALGGIAQLAVELRSNENEALAERRARRRRTPAIDATHSRSDRPAGDRHRS